MSLDNWNEFTGKNWLEPSHVEDENQAFICISVEISEDDKPLLKIEREKITYQFELNITNSVKCRTFVDAPKDLIGKSIYFNKVLAFNPKEKKEVDALRIYNIV